VIGLATSRELPELSGGEMLLYKEIARRRACKIIAWDDPNEAWRECDEIIIRCTWDYSWRLGEFLAWIDRVEAAGIRLYNSADVVRWNIDKRYLLELRERGVRIPETTWIARGELTAARLAECVLGECVIKPAVSAGAYNTLRVTPTRVREVAAELAEVSREKDILVQEYVQEIESPGEYSLIFLRGEFTHAVLKSPAAGDFRVQPRYGGVQRAATVTGQTIEQAKHALDVIPLDETPLYARVDGVLRGSEFVLMELELIEPYLFWEFGEGAAAILASLL